MSDNNSDRQRSDNVMSEVELSRTDSNNNANASVNQDVPVADNDASNTDNNDEQERQIPTEQVESNIDGAATNPPPSEEANNPPTSGEGNKAAPAQVKKRVVVDPAKLLEPIRTDPIKALEARKRRLDRQVATNMPEIHYVGQIISMEKVINDPTEGAFCRWKVDHGKVWELLGGEVTGQTHISYCSTNEQEVLPLSHPIDLHFAAAGLQGWGAPRFCVQCYRLDWHGRKVLSGYGFVHLPLTTGAHRLKIPLWRPVGTPDQELSSFLLGESPALINHEPIYESAWKDRCRLLTIASGEVEVELHVINRFMSQQGIEERR